MSETHIGKAAERGNPSFVWRAGQARRMQMIQTAAGERIHGKVFEVGVGLGQYLRRIQPEADLAVGLDVEHNRLVEANPGTDGCMLSVGEAISVADNTFDLILCNEVLEHVTDDRETVEEMLRVLKPGGRMVIFVPNRGYPFETHGIYRKGEYKFGNKLFVNYLPRKWRDKLAPHVRAYSRRDMVNLFADLPLEPITRTVIFGGYDNIVVRFGALGKVFRGVLQFLEQTPLRGLGLSHLWVLEKK